MVIYPQDPIDSATNPDATPNQPKSNVGEEDTGGVTPPATPLTTSSPAGEETPLTPTEPTQFTASTPQGPAAAEPVTPGPVGQADQVAGAPEDVLEPISPTEPGEQVPLGSDQSVIPPAEAPVEPPAVELPPDQSVAPVSSVPAESVPPQKDLGLEATTHEDNLTGQAGTLPPEASTGTALPTGSVPQEPPSSQPVQKESSTLEGPYTAPSQDQGLSRPGLPGLGPVAPTETLPEATPSQPVTSAVEEQSDTELPDSVPPAPSFPQTPDQQGDATGQGQAA